jgi:peptide/nickel transport system substrate-binding protein
VYETLTFLDPTGKIIPVLATDWKSNADGTEWDFHLRKDVKFHDGTPMTANDVKASLDRNVKVGLVAYDFIGVDSITVVDDSTVHFKCSAPRNMPLILTAQYGMFIYSAKSAEAGQDFFAKGNTDSGTGPYTIQSFDPGKDLVVSYYKDYRGGWKPGQFTKVIFEIVSDPTVRDQMIRSSQADLTFDLPLDSLDSLKSVPGLVQKPFQPSAHLVAGFAMRFAPLDNLKVRQALVDSFPYQQVKDGVYLGMGDLPKGFGPNYLWNPPADFPSYTQDMAKAKTLLAEAGMSSGFTLKLALLTGAKEPLDAAQLWQAELAKLNIKLDIQELSNSAFWDYAYKTDSKDFNIYMVVASGDLPSPWAWLVDFTSSPLGWLPFLGYNNPAFDKLVSDAWAKEASDSAAAHDIWVQAQRNLYDNAASVFIMDVPYVFVYRDNLVGLTPNPAYVYVVKWYDLTRK